MQNLILHLFPVKQTCTLKLLLVQAAIYFNSKAPGKAAQIPLLSATTKELHLAFPPFFHVISHHKAS